MKTAFALAALLCIALPARADQWTVVADKKTAGEWALINFEEEDAGVIKQHQPPLVFYAVGIDALASGEYAAHKRDWAFGSLPLFEATFIAADKADKVNSFTMKLKPTPYRGFVKINPDKSKGAPKSSGMTVECLGSPCLGRITSEKGGKLWEHPDLAKMTFKTKLSKDSKLAASLDGEAPKNDKGVYIAPPKPIALSAFESAAYQNLFPEPIADPKFADCSVEANYDKCRAALGTKLAAYASPTGEDFTKEELAYLKARLGAEDAKFQESYAWAKQLGAAKKKEFVAKYRAAIKTEADAYGKAAAKDQYDPNATAAGVVDLAKKETPAPTGLDKDIYLLYPQDDPNTQAFRQILSKMAALEDGGKPPKPLNDYKKRIQAEAAARAQGKGDPGFAYSLKQEVMSAVKDYVLAADKTKFKSNNGIEKAGLDEKLLLQAACTRGMAGAAVAPKGGKEGKAKKQAEAAAGGATAGVMDGASWVTVGKEDPIVGKCSQYFQGLDQQAEDEKVKTGEKGAGDLAITVPAPEADGKKAKDQKPNDGKAQDTEEPGDDKIGSHVREGAAWGLGLGFISLLAVGLMGPLGWLVVGTAVAGGFTFGYLSDKKANSK